MMNGRILPPGNYGFQDVRVGDRIDAGSTQVSPALIDQFAALTGDHYAIHIDRDAARGKGFDDRVAHGLLVLSLVDGLKNNADAKLDGLVSLGWNWRFDLPVLAGDTIQCDMKIAAKRITRSRDRGIVRIEFEVSNESGQLVQSGHNELLFDL